MKMYNSNLHSHTTYFDSDPTNSQWRVQEKVGAFFKQKRIKELEAKEKHANRLRIMHMEAGLGQYVDK